jgi:hypothetical protein
MRPSTILLMPPSAHYPSFNLKTYLKPTPGHCRARLNAGPSLISTGTRGEKQCKPRWRQGLLDPKQGFPQTNAPDLMGYREVFDLASALGMTAIKDPHDAQQVVYSLVI